MRILHTERGQSGPELFQSAHQQRGIFKPLSLHQPGVQPAAQQEQPGKRSGSLAKWQRLMLESLSGASKQHYLSQQLW